MSKIVQFHTEFDDVDKIYVCRCSRFPMLATHGDSVESAEDEMVMLLEKFDESTEG